MAKTKNISIANLRYLIIIFGVPVIYTLINTFLFSVISLMIVVVVCILAYQKAGHIKVAKTTKITENNALTAVTLMALVPIIAQAIYYYRLKRRKPTLALTYNNLGWKVFAIWLCFYILFVWIIWSMIHGAKTSVY